MLDGVIEGPPAELRDVRRFCTTGRAATGRAAAGSGTGLGE